MSDLARRVRSVLERLADSKLARGVAVAVVIGAAVMAIVTMRLAQDQAELTAPVVAAQCATGEAAKVEAIQPGACGTAATVQDQGAGKVTVAGPSGTPGAAGTAGSDGARGAAGTPGAVGAAGAVGAVGPSGAAGPTGTPGVAGAAGQDGQVGAAGADGARGPVGERGEVGPAGEAGPVGAAGQPGRDGSPAETQTFTTPTGQVYTCTRSGGTDTAPSYACSLAS